MQFTVFTFNALLSYAVCLLFMDIARVDLKDLIFNSA